MEKEELFRVNTKIPGELNQWLDERSRRTGITKSALIMLAVQSAYDQQNVLKRMADMGEVASKLDAVISVLQDTERNDPE